MAIAYKQAILPHVRTGEHSYVSENHWESLEKYRRELVTQATQLVGNSTDAEDIAQETLIEAFRNKEKLKLYAAPLSPNDAHSLGAWLRTVNKANALDLLRVRRSSAEKIERKSHLPEKTFTTGGMSAVEIHDSVANAIETLPMTMRSVVILHYWKHQTCEQIGIQLGMPTGTVKWHLAEAAVRLHSKLKLMFSEATDPKPDETDSSKN